MSKTPIRVTIWNEFLHENTRENIRKVYPDGIHQVIATGLKEQLQDQIQIRTATQDQPEHGLTDEVLAATDVLTWWGHAAQERVSDHVVDRVQERILQGMGLLVLHSAHNSKIFRRMMGTGCQLRWRDAGERERLWIVNPSHPIVEGMAGEYFELPHTEMYGECFDIPAPDDLILISWFEGGEVFRSGCTFRRGKGKIFYFRPGHEEFPIYYDPNIRRILANGVCWAAPTGAPYHREGRNISQPVTPFHSEHEADEGVHSRK